MRFLRHRRPTGAIRVTDVKRLNLAPGDKLVITCPEELTAEEAQRIVDAFERFAPGVSIAVLDCGRDVSVLRSNVAVSVQLDGKTIAEVAADIADDESPRRSPIFALSPTWDETREYARRLVAARPDYALADVRHLDRLSDINGIQPDAIVVELPGAERSQHYSALCNALSHKGVRFCSDGTRIEEGSPPHPLPAYPPPPPKDDPGIPTRHGPGA